MKIICEDRCGHELPVVAWVDSQRNLRLVVQNFCPQCDHINIEVEAKDLARQIVKDIRGGRVDDPVVDLLG